MKQKLLTALLSAGLAYLTAGNATAVPPDRSSEIRDKESRSYMNEERAGHRSDTQITLAKAINLYQSVVKGAHGRVPEKVLASARCIAVIPDVLTGALVVGGSHGAGVASCKEKNAWSSPSFVKLNAVSFGAQIGGKSSDLVLFMVSERAESALKRGSITLGSDVSVAAGTFDRSMDTSGQGIIAYTRTEGAFAGVSLSGGNISTDDKNTTAFYGTNLKSSALLSGSARTSENTQAKEFVALLPEQGPAGTQG